MGCPGGALIDGNGRCSAHRCTGPGCVPASTNDCRPCLQLVSASGIPLTSMAFTSRCKARYVCVRARLVLREQRRYRGYRLPNNPPVALSLPIPLCAQQQGRGSQGVAGRRGRLTTGVQSGRRSSRLTHARQGQFWTWLSDPHRHSHGSVALEHDGASSALSDRCWSIPWSGTAVVISESKATVNSRVNRSEATVHRNPHSDFLQCASWLDGCPCSWPCLLGLRAVLLQYHPLRTGVHGRRTPLQPEV
jgi:hypothetical protein